MADAAATRKTAATAAMSMLLEVDPETGHPFAFSDRAAALWMKAFADAGGLVLDPKIWRVDDGAHEVVLSLLIDALTRGLHPVAVFTAFVYGDAGQRSLHDPYGTWQLAGDPKGEAIANLFQRELLRALKGVSAAQRKAFRR